MTTVYGTQCGQHYISAMFLAWQLSILLFCNFLNDIGLDIITISPPFYVGGKNGQKHRRHLMVPYSYLYERCAPDFSEEEERCFIFYRL